MANSTTSSAQDWNFSGCYLQKMLSINNVKQMPQLKETDQSSLSSLKTGLNKENRNMEPDLNNFLEVIIRNTIKEGFKMIPFIDYLTDMPKTCPNVLQNIDIRPIS